MKVIYYNIAVFIYLDIFAQIEIVSNIRNVIDVSVLYYIFFFLFLNVNISTFQLHINIIVCFLTFTYYL